MTQISPTTQIPIEKIKLHATMKVRQKDIPTRYLATCREAGAILEPSICSIDQKTNSYTLMSHPWAWHAAQLLKYKTIPVIALSDGHSGYTPYSEVSDAADIIERATELDRVLQEQKLTVAQLADRLGKNRTTLAHTLQLKNLNTASVDAYRRRLIKKGHALRLAKLNSKHQQQTLTWLTRNKKTPTVAALENYIKNGNHKSELVKEKSTNMNSKQVVSKDADVIRIEKLIGEHFGCDVSLENGKLLIDYCGNNSVLEGILDKSGFRFS